MVVNCTSNYCQTSNRGNYSKCKVPTSHTTFRDVYERTKNKSTPKHASCNETKVYTPQSVAQKKGLELDETGVPQTYFPSWPKEIRNAFWEHDKNLTLLEQAASPSGRIALDMRVNNYNPNNYSSTLTEKDKFLAMIEDIKSKWEKDVTNAALPQNDKEVYMKALRDVDKIMKRI